jgi:Domain of unknown function (DUF4394)
VRPAAAALAAAALLTLPASAGAAESFLGVTEGSRLVRFQSDSPGAVRSSRPITGMLESERVLALDFRPATGGLYGLGSSNRIYLIDPRTGRAAPVGPFLEITLNGLEWGLDADPVNDVLRVVGDAELNFRVDPDTGRAIDAQPASSVPQPDGDLSWGPGENPNVEAIAYSGARLFALDTIRDVLATIPSPNSGVLRLTGPLGVSAGSPAALDFARGGLWATFPRVGTPVELFRLDPATGRARRATRRAAVGTYVGRQRDPVRALTAAGAVPDDRRAPRLTLLAKRSPGIRGLLRRRPLVLRLHCSEACRIRVRLSSRGRRVGGTTGEVRGTAGSVRLRARLTRRGRRIVRRTRRVRFVVSARDEAGNLTRRLRRRR